VSGEWLTMGHREHKCDTPAGGQIERTGASEGALWRCSECGLVWELSVDSGRWTWSEYQQAEKGPVWPA